MDILQSPKDKGNNPKPGHGNPGNQSSPEADAIDRLTGKLETMFEWFKSHADFVTKTDLREMEKRIMALLDDIITDVQEETTVIESVVTLLTSLSEQLKAAGTDPIKLAALKTQIDNNKKALADAVIANTPTPPPPTP